MDSAPDVVIPVEIDSSTVRSVCDLAVAADQRAFVAPNAVSIAEAHFSSKAWFRAVQAGSQPVGFVMLEIPPGGAEVFLWRFMIDARFQRRGYGRQALGLILDHVRSLPGVQKLVTSVVQAPGGPQPFYEGLGFVATGRFEEGEALLELPVHAPGVG